MKAFRRYLCLLFISLGVASSAATTARVSLDVRVEQITDHIETWRSTFGYWIEREARNARVAVANLKQSGNRTIDANVEFFLFGQRVDGAPALELYHYHKRPITLPPSRAVQVVTLSPSIVLRKMLAKLPEDRSEVSGMRPYGWVVLVKQGDAVVASAGNTPDANTNLQKILVKTNRSTLEKLHSAAEERLARKN